MDPQLPTSHSSFQFKQGELYCEGINLEEFLASLQSSSQKRDILIEDKITSLDVDVPPTPLFLYSLATLKNNVIKYRDAINKSQLKCRLGYAVKANGNHSILKSLKEFGVEMLVSVSGNEVLAGIKAGFTPQNIILNGNGKQEWEIKLAIQLGVLLNVDSIFDAQNIANLHQNFYPNTQVRVLLRIRPSTTIHKKDATSKTPIHPYVNTAESSKFGFGMDELDQVLKILQVGGIQK